jgi:hypothetical protein
MVTTDDVKELIEAVAWSLERRTTPRCSTSSSSGSCRSEA